MSSATPVGETSQKLCKSGVLGVRHQCWPLSLWTRLLGRPTIDMVFFLAGIVLAVAAFAQHPFERVAVLSGDYSGLPDQSYRDGPEFGHSVDITSDWSGHWIAVGAPGTAVDRLNSQNGAVFLFRKQDGNWQLEERIIPPNQVFTDSRCGTSVALAGPHLIVGCPGTSDTEISSINVWIYHRDSNGEWSLKLKVNHQNAEAYCGTSVVLAFNPLNLNMPAVAVWGCPYTNSDPSFSGSVWRASFDGDNWSAVPGSLNYSDAANGDQFGAALGLYRFCSLPDSCLTQLAVGAPTKQHSNSDDAGSVYVFQNWIETHIFTHPSPYSFDKTLFGASVDINASQLLVGAPGGYTTDCPDPPRCGYLRRWEADGNNWLFTMGGGAINAGGEPPGEQLGMQYGQAVALGFDNWIAVAAPYTDGPDGSGGMTKNVGMIELRRGSNGDWGSDWDDTQGEIRPHPLQDNNATDSHFGTSVAFGDFLRWLAVGVPGALTDAAPQVRRGQVWVYDIADGIFADRFAEQQPD